MPRDCTPFAFGLTAELFAGNTSSVAVRVAYVRWLVLEFRLAREAAEAAVRVPIPSASRFCGPLAQLAEQQTLNLRVEGSIPSRLTTFHQQFSTSRPDRRTNFGD